MAEGYWLINSNRSEVRRFTENRKNLDQFINMYLLILGRLLERNEFLLKRKEETLSFYNLAA